VKKFFDIAGRQEFPEMNLGKIPRDSTMFLVFPDRFNGGSNAKPSFLSFFALQHGS